MRTLTLYLYPPIFILSQIHFCIWEQWKRNQNRSFTNKIGYELPWNADWKIGHVIRLNFIFNIRVHTISLTHTRTHKIKEWIMLSNEHYSFSHRFVLCGGEKCALGDGGTHNHTSCQSTNQSASQLTHTLFVIDLHT